MAQEHISIADARKILGVDAQTFQAWLNRELLPFETVEHKSRTYRRISAEHIELLTIVAALTRCDLAISASISTAKLILEALPEMLTATNPPTYVVYTNMMLRYLHSGERFVDILREMENCACVALDLRLLQQEIAANKRSVTRLRDSKDHWAVGPHARWKKKVEETQERAPRKKRGKGTK